MSILDTIRIALNALRANKLRSFLTALGIILGVAAVICMVAVGEGARAQVSDKIKKLGTNLLFIQPDGYPGRRHSLTEDDASTILRELPGVQISAPIIWGEVQAVAGNKHWKTTVWGNDADYLDAREWPVSAGRLFTAQETASGAKVAILGSYVAAKLFGGEPGIGETIRVGKVPFTVIGTLEKKGESGSGKIQDDLIVVPLSAARSRLLGGQPLQADEEEEGEKVRATDESSHATKVKYPDYQHQVSRQALDYLVVKVRGDFSVDGAKLEIRDVLRRQHHLRANEPDDFSISNPADALVTQETSARSFSLLLAAIASISLAVGGISIMNTMLVAVAERTREIGLRMAVGAQRGDIRNQFLLEAAVLALLGGLAGVGIGAVTAVAVAKYGGWPVFISPGVILLACAFTSMVGVGFGLFPAYRASRLDPMVALRFE